MSEISTGATFLIFTTVENLFVFSSRCVHAGQHLLTLSTCAGYHAVQHQRESNRVNGRQDQRLQHVQPDPPPHQIRHEAHHL